MSHRWTRFVALPRHITPFEASYLARVNRLALLVVAAHAPILTLFAWWNDTGPGTALALSALALAGPAIAHRYDDQPRRVSVVMAVAAVLMAGILVHVGQGPMQIEMHFHFFVVIAALAVFGNPTVVLVAAGTVALHHGVVWLLHPTSVFNYEASFAVVAVHALFIVLEAVGACFLARSFFDNVIGLERIVGRRTADLEAGRRGNRLLLDNVAQGILVMEASGAIGREHSRPIDQWFGEAANEASWFAVLDAVAPAFGRRSRSGWEAVVEDFLPLELTLEQMPNLFEVGERTLRVEYRPIAFDGSTAERFLVVVTDVSSEVQRAAADADRAEDVQLVSALLDDRSGTLAFLDDALQKVGALESAELGRQEQGHLLHTLKGNASLVGLSLLATRIHAIEDRLDERERALDGAALAPFIASFDQLASRCGRMRGEASDRVEVAAADLKALERAILEGVAPARLLDQVRDLRREAAGLRLARLGEHARRVAEQLGKGRIEVEVSGGEVRVDPTRWAPVWASLVHAVRNAVDHGVEGADERVRAGKPPAGKIALRASQRDGWVVVEVSDDGRGIDLEGVRRRAGALGLPTSSDDEVLAATWADGVSTSSVPSEVSGRGVGMSAIRSAVESLGGTVELQSEAGHGLRIRLLVPRRSVEESHAGLLEPSSGAVWAAGGKPPVRSRRRPSSGAHRAVPFMHGRTER